MSNILAKEKKTECTGCGACKRICIKKAIDLIEDEEGFLYPQINLEKCISCDLCKKVCPVKNKPASTRPLHAYAVQLKNVNILKESSSGGAFYIFAKSIINRKGVVYGCTWDDDFNAVITSARTLNELSYMHGSKYVQSNPLDSFKTVKELLKKGEIVLYTGTPCQIAGLKKYLKNDYCNLYTLDFLCHGVPSPLMFHAYLKDLGKKTGEKITSYKFRDKERKGWGLNSSYTFNKKNSILKKLDPGFLNTYMYGFIKGYFNRLVCYNCPFTGIERFSDVTIGDYWGVENFHNQFDISKGVSFILINSEKAGSIISENENDTILINTKIDYIKVNNKSLNAVYTKEKKEIKEIRNSIYYELKSNGYNYICKKYLITNNYYVLLLLNKISLLKNNKKS